METKQEDEKFGIPHCINCILFHPDDKPSIQDLKERLLIPQQVIFKKFAQLKNKLHLYANKSCMVCGRTYFSNGEFDETWVLTAKRVKEEFDRMGIFGLSEQSVNHVVAIGKMRVEYLIANRIKINPEFWGIYTFSGTVAKWITYGQIHGRQKMERDLQTDLIKLKQQFQEIKDLQEKNK